MMRQDRLQKLDSFKRNVLNFMIAMPVLPALTIDMIKPSIVKDCKLSMLSSLSL